MSQARRLAVVVLALAGCGQTPFVRSGANDVYYHQGTTEDEAQRLADYIRDKWPPSHHRRELHLVREGDRYQIRTTFDKDFYHDERIHKRFGLEMARASRDVFAGAPVELVACKEDMTPVRAIPISPSLRHGVVEGNVEVFFPMVGQRDDAERLAKFLSTTFTPPTTLTFKISPRNDGVVIGMIALPEALGNEKLLKTLEADRKAIQKNVFPGQGVELHLCNELFDTVRVIEADGSGLRK